MIEVTEEFKKEIMSTFRYKRMFYIKNIKIDKNRKGLSFLKVKSLKKYLKEKFVFSEDLNNLVEYHQWRVKRLNS